jgi:hypothetical protein
VEKDKIDDENIKLSFRLEVARPTYETKNLLK